MFRHIYLCSLSMKDSSNEEAFPEEGSGRTEYLLEIAGIQSVVLDDHVFLHYDRKGDQTIKNWLRKGGICQ